MNENTQITEPKWSTVITSKKPLFHLPIVELWRYRDLMLMFVRRDFITNYQQTVLGPIWYFIQPIFTTIVFTVIFGRLAGITTDGIPEPLFFMSGIVVWNYFQSCVSRNSTIFTGNARVFGKVYFPRLVLPISTILSNVLYFILQFSLFLCLYAFFIYRGADVNPSWRMAVVVVLLFQMGILGMGVGCIISSLTTKYRDLSMLMGFGLQLWMYGSLVMYPLSIVPEEWRAPLLIFNPMAAVIETFRVCVIGEGVITHWQWATSFVISCTVLFVGILIFNRTEKDCMDVV
jgi:lipopolysaccharide transport system permease protein